MFVPYKRDAVIKGCGFRQIKNKNGSRGPAPFDKKRKGDMRESCLSRFYHIELQTEEYSNPRNSFCNNIKEHTHNQIHILFGLYCYTHTCSFDLSGRGFLGGVNTGFSLVNSSSKLLMSSLLS